MPSSKNKNEKRIAPTTTYTNITKPLSWNPVNPFNQMVYMTATPFSQSTVYTPLFTPLPPPHLHPSTTPYSSPLPAPTF